MKELRIGSEEHKRLFCRFFLDTHTPFRVPDLSWPDLDAASRDRLASLPVWNEAVYTEADTALKVQTLGKAEPDPLMAEAISMNGLEEGRHAEMLRILVERYHIPIEDRPPPVPPENPEWHFMRVGYGECFDSFFAFGLFALARESGFFPPGLVGLFDPIMQEEARHIIFHVNWVAYKQATLPAARRPRYVFKRGLAMWLQAASRVKTAMKLSGGGAESTQDNFAMTAHASFGDFSVRQFLEICLRENAKRVAPYDERLLRPTLVPGIARAMLSMLGGSQANGDVAAPKAAAGP